jgi:hypothetical protein
MRTEITAGAYFLLAALSVMSFLDYTSIGTQIALTVLSMVAFLQCIR